MGAEETSSSGTNSSTTVAHLSLTAIALGEVWSRTTGEQPNSTPLSSNHIAPPTISAGNISRLQTERSAISMRWKRFFSVPSTEQSPQSEGNLPGILDDYVRTKPSAQNAVDIFSGEWTSRFTDEVGLVAGHVPLFDDPRITWVIEQMGSVTGRRVLELGPLEGGHTAMLDHAGASVLAIESNARAFLKCLIAKEVLNLQKSKFELGDFAPYLDETSDKFDLVVASGVLYHSPDPLGLLGSLGRVADRVAIWTHYFDPEITAARESLRRVFTDEPVVVDWNGTTRTLHRRHYLEALAWGGFCGGPETSALWLERDELLDTLQRVGFTDIKIESENRENQNGACIMLLASK